MASSKRAAVVRGAASGIAAVYADQLAHRGDDLMLAGRHIRRRVRLYVRLGLWEFGLSGWQLIRLLSDFSFSSPWRFWSHPHLTRRRAHRSRCAIIRARSAA